MESDEVEGFDTPVDPDECDKARLIGEIVREFVIGLGDDQAMTPDAVVIIGERGSGRPAPRSARPVRACLDAEIGGDDLGIVPVHGNVVAPQVHGQAAAFWRGAGT